MKVVESLKDLFVELQASSSAEDIGRAHLALVQRLGFVSNLIVDLSKTFDGIGPAIIFAAQARRPLEAMDTVERLADRPIFRRCSESDQPFAMSALKQELGIGDETWWRMFPPYFRGFDGFIVPIHQNGAAAWHVGCAGPAPDLSWYTRSILIAAAYATRERFLELLDPKTAQSPLTPREAECLRYVAQGKTDEDIGALLNISARTVRFHVGNAKTKLGVTTRIQAVAKRLGAA